MQKISPFLWFNGQAEEAANFYVSLFRDSKIVRVVRNGEVAPGPTGDALVVEFELFGQAFTAMNGGPNHPFTDAISLLVECEDQVEIDRYWNALIADGGAPVACGWLKDKYGLSWQIAPKRLLELIGSPDRVQADRVMAAMMQMIKIDLGKIEAAAAG